MTEIYDIFLQNISPTDTNMYNEAKAYIDKLAKPPGSLGKLEDIAAKICAITGQTHPETKKRCVIVLASDNGVFLEGVASAPQEVTAIQTINIANKITGVGVVANQFNTDLVVADVGVNADIPYDKVLNRKIRKSTNNIKNGPAMTREEAKKAIMIGINLVKDAKQAGYKLLGVGEMGIGNTTTSSAVLASLLGLSDKDISNVVGKGAGLDENAYNTKINVIKTAITINKPNQNDVIDILSKVGGFDLASMTGVYIGCAYYKIPVVIDGFISAVAALCAIRLNPHIKDYMFASHHSFERGYALAINELGLSACLSLDMRLGEGSGCPLMFAIIDTAVAVIKNMATFNQANIEDDYLDNIREIGATAF